jgi:hypothetical protein
VKTKSPHGEKYGNPKQLRDYYTNIGKSYRADGDLAQAHYYFQHAEFYKRINKPDFM